MCLTMRNLLNANVSIRFEMSTKYERIRGNEYFYVLFFASYCSRHRRFLHKLQAQIARTPQQHTERKVENQK